MTRLRAALAAIAMLAAIASCARTTSDGGGSGGTGPATSYQPDDEVIRISHIGGFVYPSYMITRLPAIAVYGDGRVFTEGATPAIYPGPAWPAVELRHISAADVRKLVSLAATAGIGLPTDYGTPTVTDMPNTRFTVLTANGVKQTEVYALQEDMKYGLTSSQVRARSKLLTLQAKLLDLPSTLGAGAVSATAPYKPAGFVAVVDAWAADGTGVPPPPEVTWPGPALPGEEVNYGQHCVTVTGTAAQAVFEQAQQATTNTPWVWDGQRWRLAFRPLLPAEVDCKDLAK